LSIKEPWNLRGGLASPFGVAESKIHTRCSAFEHRKKKPKRQMLELAYWVRKKQKKKKKAG